MNEEDIDSLAVKDQEQWRTTKSITSEINSLLERPLISSDEAYLVLEGRRPSNKDKLKNFLQRKRYEGLKAVKIGKEFRYDPDDLIDFIKECKE
ncbi:MAG: hypothetical protein COA79_19090 [Planctomycetota bacterium]|nr:MAG: hypothetical protein COA79_19090 [Planctomycetota bacterium]